MAIGVMDGTRQQEEFTTEMDTSALTSQLEFPDSTVDGTVEAFEEYLRVHADDHGIGALDHSWHNFSRLQARADKWRNDLQLKIDRINGVKPARRAMDPTVRKLRSAAKAFFKPMNSAQLRAQCGLAGLNYDSYSSIEDIEAALIDKYVAGATQQ